MDQAREGGRTSNNTTCTSSISKLQEQTDDDQDETADKAGRSNNTTPITFLAGDACRYPVVRAAAARMGWKLVSSPLPSSASSCFTSCFSAKPTKRQHQGQSQSQQQLANNCNVIWVDISILADYFLLIQPWQCINHFPGMVNIARKTRLAQNLEAMKKRFPSQYDFSPQTFALPKDFTVFRGYFASDSGHKSKYTWIVKPDGGAKGKGIFLTKDLTEIQRAVQENGCSYVAQRYISNPMLIGGKKFDLRLYVLVTSCDPLRVYLFRDGLCRLCTADFVKPSAKNMKSIDRCAHLTNYSINKRSSSFVRNDADCEVDENGDCISRGSGSKRSVSWLLSWLRQEYGDEAVDKLWCEIGDICAKTVISVLPTLVSEYQATFGPEPPAPTTSSSVKGSRCFEILGFDIMLQEQQRSVKPYLIEVNHLPSFGTDAPLDKAVKSRVIEQAMGVVHAKATDRRVYEKSQRKRSRHRLVRRRRDSSILSTSYRNPSENDDVGCADTSNVDGAGVGINGVEPLSSSHLPPTAKSILESIYKEHAPEKLCKVDSLLIKFRGYEEWLINKVRQRYCIPKANVHNETCADEDSIADGIDCNRDGKFLLPTMAQNNPYMMSSLETDDTQFISGSTTNGGDSYEGSNGADADMNWSQEEATLKDYDRIYPPQPRHKRPFSTPPYEAMKEYAFKENAKQVERLTVPLHLSRTNDDAEEKSHINEDMTNHELSCILRSHQSRSDSWISGSLHLRKASKPAKIRHPPTKRQIESFDRLSRGFHAIDRVDDEASGNATKSEGHHTDPFNASIEMSEKEATLRTKHRWDLVRRVRTELEQAKERRKRNQDLRGSLALRSVDLTLGYPCNSLRSRSVLGVTTSYSIGCNIADRSYSSTTSQSNSRYLFHRR